MSNGLYKDPYKEYKERVKDLPVYSQYPLNSKDLYFVEFREQYGETNWTLFKRNYLYTEEEWARIVEKNGYLFMSREFHPWNLGGGKVIKNEDAVCMNTESFLKNLVDALNLKEKLDKEAKLD